MEEPKQLSVSELRKKFESKPSTSTTAPITKPTQSTTTQPPRQTFPVNPQPNGTTDDNKPAASEPNTANLSVKERMKMFDKSKTQQETQPAPLQPKKTQVPTQATENNNKAETENISAQPEKLIVAEPEPVQEPVQAEQQEEIPQEPTQQEEVHQEIQQTQEIQQEEIAPQVVVQEEVVPEVQEPIKEAEVVQEKEQEIQVPVVVIVEKEETKAPETQNTVLNKNAGFASEMNAMLAKKGLRSNEESPIKPEQSKNQGLSNGDAYTEALLARPKSDPRKKKAKLVFIDDEDF